MLEQNTRIAQRLGWLTFNLRWLLLLAAACLVLTGPSRPGPAAILLIVLMAAYNFGLTLYEFVNPGRPWLISVTLALDFSLGLGLYLASGGRRLRPRDVVQPAALCGLGAGLSLTLCSIFVKLATREVHTADKILAALCALCVAQGFQVAMQGGYLLLRERGEMTRVLRSWRSSSLVGLLSTLGSACWWSGFALAPVALVRTVGQVEVIFTLGFGHLYLHETIKRHEVIALFCVGVGVALALAGSL